MSALNNNLLAAVEEAFFPDLDSDEELTHLSAQRRILANGTEEWEVFISYFFAPRLTHITDDMLGACPAKSVNEIAALIAGCWEPEWDEIPDGRGGYVTRSVMEAA